MADRAANRIVVVDTNKDVVVHEISLVGSVSQNPAPDLIEASPNGDWVFVTLRGPSPLTGNVPSVNNALGNTPGVGIMRVEWSGQRGTLRAVAPISHLVGGVERADPHSIAVRRT